VVAGTLLTFIPAVGDYINAQLLGNTETRMIGNVIESLFITVGDYPAAASLSMVLMLLIAGMVFLYVRKSGTEEIL
jgi:spermidine/putrescine transport system permease protein